MANVMSDLEFAVVLTQNMCRKTTTRRPAHHPHCPGVAFICRSGPKHESRPQAGFREAGDIL